MVQGAVENKSRSFCSLLLVFLLLMTLPVIPVTSALDGDGDGVDDALDDCEFAAGNSTIDYSGCPDFDGDGNPNFIGSQVANWESSERALYHSGGDSRAVAWSPDGVHIVGGGGHDVNLYWVGGHISTLVTISENVRALRFSPNGSYLAVGGYEEDNWNQSRGWMLVLEMDWVAKTATVLRNLSHYHIGDVPSLVWSANGSYLYTGGEDQIRRFSVQDNWTMDMNYTFQDGNVWALDLSPDGRLVAGISGGAEMKVYWVNNGTQYMGFANHTDSYALALKFSPDGRWLLTGGNDNDIHVYNVSNKSWETYIDTGSDVYGISFDPTGAYFISARGGSSTTRVYQISNWTQTNSFGSFGSRSSNRGLRAVDWSPDNTAIAFAQRRGRITVHLLPEGFMQVTGGDLPYLLEDAWRQAWQPNGGKLLGTTNSTQSLGTMEACMGQGNIHAGVDGASRAYVTPQANHSTTGLVDCLVSSDTAIELPVGRYPAVFAVKQGGEVDACLTSMGGLSTAQIRWMLSAGSSSTLSNPIGDLPGIDKNSVAPNEDSDSIKEWSDLSANCPKQEIVFVHLWENKTDFSMLLDALFCGNCQEKDSIYAHSNDRARFTVEWRNQVLTGLTAPSGDGLLGMVELMYAIENPANITLLPLVDNLTHGAADAIAAGQSAVQPTYNNSRDDIWPIQTDFRYLVNSNVLEDKRLFLEWSLSEPGMQFWEDQGFVRMHDIDLVRSWGMLGHDMTWMLPDDDNDGIWNGVDDCPETPAGLDVDDVGCAESQLDDDFDGLTNDLDDCDDIAGDAIFPPYIGCPDTDSDGYADMADDFIDDPSQWNDSDSDGYGDETLGFQPDGCPDVFGNSTVDRFGCIDSDGDGRSDPDSGWGLADGADAFIDDPTQWSDIDGDGYGDNYDWEGPTDMRSNENGDAVIDDATQWRDKDGDGFGDNQSGTNGDDCPGTPGTSIKNQTYGCVDGDGDGYADSIDDLPLEPTQWWDRDGDLFGDNIAGTNADYCPDTPDEEIDDVNDEGCGPSERDSDFDGINDIGDECPQTPPFEVTKVGESGCAPSELDSDFDGANDEIDWAPFDSNQTTDSDGDGFGDNHLVPGGDDCPNQAGTSTIDRSGCTDSDGDGYSDPSSTWTISLGADWRSNDATQWRDSDGDGYGDNWGDSGWGDGRMANWPGEFILGATKPDKCPMDAYEYAQSDGCPPGAGDTGGDQNEGQAESQSTGSSSSMMFVIIGGGGIVVLVLVGVVVMLLRKPPPPSRGPRKPRQETGLSDSADLVESSMEEAAAEQSDWVETWEQLPSGGEYLPADADGIVWYQTPDGSHWKQGEDESWSLWQG